MNVNTQEQHRLQELQVSTFSVQQVGNHMKQIKPGDAIAFESEGKYYYAIILTKIVRFGGNLIYAFHTHTNKILKLEELLSLDLKGFNIVADFIFAKRENRITKLGNIVNYSSFRLYNFFKNTNEWRPNKKAEWWHIYDEKFQEVRKTIELSAEERKYPLTACFGEELVIKKIKNKWMPELDIKI